MGSALLTSECSLLYLPRYTQDFALKPGVVAAEEMYETSSHIERFCGYSCFTRSATPQSFYRGYLLDCLTSQD